jgi:alkylation response protein AidB-like acyl-CoA dehydrogenase
MDVEFTEEQVLLRDSAREFLSSECPVSLVREMMDDAVGNPLDLWKQMAELGWMGLVIEEQYGGAELDLVDLAVLLEEMGRCLLPAPFFSTVVVAGSAIALAGSPDQKQHWLPRIAAGDAVFALAELEEHADWGPDGIGMRMDARPDGTRLDGRKTFVRDALSADTLLVPVRRTLDEGGGDELALLIVSADAPGLSIESIACIDQTRKLCQIDFDGVKVEPNEILADHGGGWRLLERVHDVAKVALCAEACGGGQAMLDMSVAYARTREQFGKPIGSFQAIQHKCADMLVQVECSRSATYYAAWSVANHEPDAHAAACLAKSYCSEAYAKICGAGIQIHGGLGFTWEQDPHLYYKRAKADELYLADASFNRELAAREILGETAR